MRSSSAASSVRAASITSPGAPARRARRENRPAISGRMPAASSTSATSGREPRVIAANRRPATGSDRSAARTSPAYTPTCPRSSVRSAGDSPDNITVSSMSRQTSTSLSKPACPKSSAPNWRGLRLAPMPSARSAQHGAAVAQPGRPLDAQRVRVDPGHLPGHVGAHAQGPAVLLVDELEGLQVHRLAGAREQRVEVLDQRGRDELEAPGARKIEHPPAQALDARGGRRQQLVDAVGQAPQCGVRIAQRRSGLGSCAADAERGPVALWRPGPVGPAAKGVEGERRLSAPPWWTPRGRRAPRARCRRRPRRRTRRRTPPSRHRWRPGHPGRRRFRHRRPRPAPGRRRAGR